MKELLEQLDAVASPQDADLVAFYVASQHTDDWSAEVGVKLLATLRTTPQQDWHHVPDFRFVGRLVLSIVNLFVEKMDVESAELTLRLIRAADQAVRAQLVEYKFDDGARMTSVLAWHVREAVQAAISS